MSEFALIPPVRGLREWLIDVDGELRRRGPLPTTEVDERRNRAFKLPSTIRNQRAEYDEFYRPHRVSFGPYNHGDGQCEAGERVKEASLVHFLRRSQKDLRIYVEAITPLLNWLQEYYDVAAGENEESFVKMMLLDGCFILELIRTTKDLLAFTFNSASHASDNPAISQILDTPGEIKFYLHDMLLLENQLPMMLLVRLYMVDEKGYHSMEKLTMDIASKFIPRWTLPSHLFGDELPLHVLDVYRRALANHQQGRREKPHRRPIIISNIINIPSATELQKVGIGVTTSTTARLTDIRFRRNTLMLPLMAVDVFTKSAFLNLLALEQAHRSLHSKHVTAYVFIMGGLVQSADDAALLQSRGVLVSALPAVELAEVFRGVSRGVSLEPELNPSYFVMEKLRERFNKMSNEWRKDLFQTYLRSPWAVMSVVAGVLLFVLSTIQTVYAVLSYVRPR